MNSLCIFVPKLYIKFEFWQTCKFLAVKLDSKVSCVCLYIADSILYTGYRNLKQKDCIHCVLYGSF